MRAKHAYWSVRAGLETFSARRRAAPPPSPGGLCERRAGRLFCGSRFWGPREGPAWRCASPRAVLTATPIGPIARGPVQILRLPWLDDRIEGHFRVSDPDILAQLAERDPRESTVALAENLSSSRFASCSTGRADWRWRFRILRPCHSEVGAGQLGMRPEALSRDSDASFGCRQSNSARGTSQACLARHPALASNVDDHCPGIRFSDLAHLSRSVRSLTDIPKCVRSAGSTPR